jgi:hypothetical protein
MHIGVAQTKAATSALTRVFDALWRPPSREPYAQPTERARLHSPSKTGVNALMLGPCFRRDDIEESPTQHFVEPCDFR